MLGFALCHGWGFDAHAMVPLRQALQQRFPHAEFAMFDLGFTGAGHLPALHPHTDWVAVGHSWGFAYLMQQTHAWSAAISLNGFTRFCRRPGSSVGTPPRVVDAMLAQLENDAPALIKEFHARCGWSGEPDGNLDAVILTRYLSQLRELDIHLPTCPILSLASEDDLIVPAALTQACFDQADCIQHAHPGSHVEFLINPDPAVAAIEKFCKERLCTIR